MAYSMLYGDLIVLMANQCRPYEVIEGETDRRVEKWVNRLTAEFKKKGSFKSSHIRNNFNLIADDFASILVKRVPKVKVGIVGEIYVKFAPLGNNNLEEFLLSEGCEPVVPGLTDFIIFKCDNRVEDHRLYGGKFATYLGAGFLKRYLMKLQRYMIEAVKRHPEFRAPCTFGHLKKLVRGYLGYGNKMGEGWLLTAEMLELIDSGKQYCVHPAVRLPAEPCRRQGHGAQNQNNLPQANIVCIDYDPGATGLIRKTGLS